MNVFQAVIKNIFSLSSDIVIIAALVAIFASVGLFFGKGRLVALILSFYPAGLIFKNLPFFKKFIVFSPNATSGETITGIAVFVVLYALIYIAIQAFIMSEFPFSGVLKVMQAGVLGISATALLLLFSLHVINISKIYKFSTGIEKIFQGNAFFWILLAPFVFLFIFRK